MSNAVLLMKSFGFSPRTANALVNAGFCELWEIARASKRELFCIPNIGRKALKEIDEILFQRGYLVLNDSAKRPAPHWPGWRDGYVD